jgi:SAM-dependent methyltransferase
LSIKALFNAVNKIFHFNHFQCPFCHEKFLILRKKGRNIPLVKEKQLMGGGARRTTCPGCGSTDRERLIYLYLTEHSRLMSNDNINTLHIAPEKVLANFLRNYPKLKYIAGDKFMEGYNYPSWVQEMDILNIDFPDNYFQLIICNHVLEHVEDDAKAMSELYRTLSPEGIAILQVPLSKITQKTEENFTIVSPEERERKYGQHDHVRLYGLDYVDRLKKAGFKVEIKSISNSKDYKRFKLYQNEDLYICSK